MTRHWLSTGYHRWPVIDCLLVITDDPSLTVYWLSQMTHHWLSTGYHRWPFIDCLLVITDDPSLTVYWLSQMTRHWLSTGYHRLFFYTHGVKFIRVIHSKKKQFGKIWQIEIPNSNWVSSLLIISSPGSYQLHPFKNCRQKNNQLFFIKHRDTDKYPMMPLHFWRSIPHKISFITEPFCVLSFS